MSALTLAKLLLTLSFHLKLLFLEHFLQFQGVVIASAKRKSFFLIHIIISFSRSILLIESIQILNNTSILIWKVIRVIYL